MNCQKCGTTLPVETRFCPQCGTPVALSPSQRVSIPADIAQRAERFAGRLWVLNEVIDWLDCGSKRFLLITGEPGCGKTTLAAWLAGTGPTPDDPDASSNLERVRDAWNAAHFCMAEDKRGTLNPARFAQSLARQLSNRYDEYAKAVLQRIAPEANIYQEAHENWGYMVGAQIDTFIVNTSAEDVYNCVVREPLEALLNHQPNLHIFIQVDALDEALTFGHPSIVTLLAGSGDLPAGVRFLLTSRNEPKVLDQFRRVRRLDLSSKGHASQADADMHIYVEQRMSEETIKPHVIAAGSPETIRERLVKQAAGNFLYIQFLLDEVAADKRSLTDLIGLPSGLFGLYHAYLDRLMPEMLQVGASQRWVELFQPLLGCLSVAVPVAPQQVLPGWLGRPEGEVEALLNDLIQLVEYDQGGYRLYHPSMAEFLGVREYQEDETLRRNRYYTPPREQHERIVRYYLSRFRANWQACDDYGLLYLTTHLHALKDVGGYRQDLYALVESQAWAAAKYVDTPWAGSLVQDLQRASATAVEGDVEDWARSMGYQLRRALVEHFMSRMSDRAILFLTKLEQADRALDFARRQWNRFNLLREIARAVAPTQPTKAVDILVELAHLVDDRSALEQCRARLAAAQDILQLAPSHSHVALDLIEEAKRLEHAIPESDLIRYKIAWDLPTLALNDDLDTALATSRTFSPLQQAQALRYTSSVLPEDHPVKQNLIEQALLTLEPLEQTPQVTNERMRVIGFLLPLVDESRQQELLRLLRSDGDYLQSVGAPEGYTGTQHWVVERVAKVDLAWAKHMLLESDWHGALEAYAVVREIARVNYEEALQLIKERFSNHALGSKLLVDIIGIVALEDTSKAEALIEEYAEQLRRNRREAHIAVAEGYLARGDTQKAREIFDEHAVAGDSESLVHARGDLQLAILARFGGFLSVEAARDRLMQFPACPRCHQDRKQEAERILACMAARQGRMDFLEEHSFNLQAQLAAAYDLADYVGPEAAREYLERQHITSRMKGAERVYAHIAAVEAQQDPTKLEILVRHFDGDGRSHHFCDYRKVLPEALCTLVQSNRIEVAEARAVIERVYSLLVDYECSQGAQSVPQRLFGGQCSCYDDRDWVLVHLVGIMAQLDPSRAEQMVDSLPSQPVKVYALKQILHHTRADEELVSRIIEVSQESIQDPWQRAASYYDLATLLPAQMRDLARYLIESAEPLLDEEPIYETSEFGMRTRVGPSRTELKIRKAQALIKLVNNITQFADVAESLRPMETLLQLDDKLRILDTLTNQALEWSEKDKLALLWQVREAAINKGLMDVQALIAFAIPLVQSLEGETAFWRLYDYVEWAYQGLPPVGQEEAEGG